MKRTLNTGLFAGILVLAVVASIGTSKLVIANPNTDNPSFHGQETKQLTQCTSNCLGEPDTNKGAVGQHTSDVNSGGQQTLEGGRNGLANALTGHGNPQHPSEVIQTLCGENGGLCP